MAAATTTPAAPPRPWLRRARFVVTVTAILALLFGVPWWTVTAGSWPAAATAGLTVGFAGAALAFPLLMVLGHGRRGRDWAARVGDTLLGVIWVAFTCAVLGNLLLRPALALAGVGDPARSRAVAMAVAATTLVLVVWGVYEALRLPRVRHVTARLERLGADLDGCTVLLLADTHFGALNRTTWSARVVAAVNALEPDIVCHAGDLADGGVARRRGQVAPLAQVQATLTRAYVTGNHEYFGQAQQWLDHMRELGWQALHNQHVVVQRGDARLVVAGVDDATAAASGEPGHGADHAAALAGADPDLPVLLLAHQPKQIDQAVAHGVDLQVSGHTHGGQIWPFHLLVRLDQPVLQGLSRHGERTQLYTTRGTGFWGPPLRVFAPSEITVITLRVG